jgi:hypothetical protein
MVIMIREHILLLFDSSICSSIEQLFSSESIPHGQMDQPVEVKE